MMQAQRVPPMAAQAWRLDVQHQSCRQQIARGRRHRDVSVRALQSNEQRPEGNSAPPSPPPSLQSDVPPNLPSRRRLLTYGSVGLAVALGGNLGGSTSGILSSSDAAVSFARDTGLDVIFPVRSFLRCKGEGFEFIYPSKWLLDQTIVRRRMESMQSSLDPPSLKQARRRSVAEPQVAYGPPNSSGETNVSVIVAQGARSAFAFDSADAAREGIEALLRGVLTPPGSDKVLTVQSVVSRPNIPGGRDPTYQVEYDISAPGRFERHNVSAFHVTADGRLFTLNVQVPLAQWNEDAELRSQAREMALSLVVR